ncbi:MAG: hypothetical protein AABN33_18315 [Acidobacteriota bacterium]
MIFFLEDGGLTMPSWSQLAQWGPTLVLVAMLIVFALKAMPTWERIKMREMEVREKEAASRTSQAAALTQLGNGIEKMSQVLENVAVEQRKATDVVKILQAANMDTQDQLAAGVRGLVERVGVLEETTK